LPEIERPLGEVRKEIQALQQQVAHDPLLNTLPSVVKRVNKGGFFFHACKDTPDVRTVFLRYLRELPCSNRGGGGEEDPVSLCAQASRPGG